VGVDVGEDFLDLAVLRPEPASLEHHRIALRGIEHDPLATLRGRLTARCHDADARWLALVDSPRWPCDLDCSSRALTARRPAPAGRTLDGALRAILRASAAHGAIQLSMFPTPKFAYFTNCLTASAHKPHLVSAYRQLFDAAAPGKKNRHGGRRYGSPRHESGRYESGSNASDSSGGAPARIAGGTFTRFMLAGFLTFRAWQELGAQTLEAYPDLQFRLSSRDPLPPKRAGKPALAARIAVIKRLRESIGLAGVPLPATIDQIDAEILALSAGLAARQNSLCALEHPAEGRFLLTI
jgi:hypothetical protein